MTAACVVLAFGVGGVERAATSASLDPSVLWIPRVLGAVVAVAAMVGLLAYRRRRTGGRKGDPVGSTILAGIVLITVLASLSILPLLMSSGGGSTPGMPPGERVAGQSDRVNQDPPMDMGGGAVRANPRDRARLDVPTMLPGPVMEREVVPVGAAYSALQRAMLFVALLVMAMVFVAAVRRALQAKPGRSRSLAFQVEEPAVPRAVRMALEDAAETLAGETPDPSNQIVGAYYRLLVALEDAGYARRPQEAPHEFLQRVLLGLGAAPVPMRRLTELYVFVEFGVEEVGPEHRAAAADALDLSLASLRGRVAPA